MVDDDRDDFELIVEAIQQIDPEISVQFLDRCEDSHKYEKRSFDLLLLDINMPFHDGFSWLRGIRKSGNTDLPIVMYTSSANPANIAKAYHDGANLYFTKPDSFDELVLGLSTILKVDWSDPSSAANSRLHTGALKIEK
jgi:DNA-binding response OmpR family regulator